jgi:hypothetical protein
MADAQYSILVPLVDNQGNELQHIADYAHQYLVNQGMVDGSWVDPPVRALWKGQDPEPHEALHTIQEDTPEMDSFIKHAAKQIGEIANQWGIFVYKTGKSGVQKWIIDNPHYREGEPADPVALAQPLPGPDDLAPSSYGVPASSATPVPGP